MCGCGRSRGGRTTKIHALTDGLCRPIALLLTGGQVADCTAGDLEQMPKSPILHVDKGLRQQRDPSKGRGQRGDAQHSTKSQSALEKLRLAIPLSGSQCDPLGDELLRRCLPRRHCQLLVVTPDPSGCALARVVTSPECL